MPETSSFFPVRVNAVSQTSFGSALLTSSSSRTGPPWATMSAWMTLSFSSRRFFSAWNLSTCLASSSKRRSSAWVCWMSAWRRLTSPFNQYHPYPMASRATTHPKPARRSLVLTGACRFRSSRGRRLILIMLLVSCLPQGQPHADRELGRDRLEVRRVDLLRVGLELPQGIGDLEGDLEIFRKVFDEAREPRGPSAEHHPMDRIAVGRGTEEVEGAPDLSGHLGVHHVDGRLRVAQGPAVDLRAQLESLRLVIAQAEHLLNGLGVPIAAHGRIAGELREAPLEDIDVHDGRAEVHQTDDLVPVGVVREFERVLQSKGVDIHDHRVQTG